MANTFKRGTVNPGETSAKAGFRKDEPKAGLLHRQATDISGTEVLKNLAKRFDTLELSVRSANCLENANIRYVYELVQKTDNELLRTKNFGRKSLKELEEILGGMGLGLEMTLSKEGQQAALAIHFKSFAVGHHFDGVDDLAGQAIDGAEHLQGANEIKFLYRRHDDDDDAAALARSTSRWRSVAVDRWRHRRCKYAAGFFALAIGGPCLAEIV